MSNLIAKAVIIAAGRGSRMMPLTNDIPKCLAILNGKPLLYYSLTALKKNGIEEITLVHGYRGQQIEDYTSKYFPELKFNYIINSEWAETNSLFSLSKALYSFDDFAPYIMLESDLVYGSELIEELLDCSSNISTLLHPYEDSLTGTFALVSENIVTEWAHETRQGINFPYEKSYKTVNITTIKSKSMHDEILKAINTTLSKDGQKAPLEYAMQRLIENCTKINVMKTKDAVWAELDTKDELLEFEKQLLVTSL
jgi:choline kinase